MKEQFTKTKLCPFFLRGNCSNGTSCSYAHAEYELRPMPDLQNTKLCGSVTRGYICRSPSCCYAHSRADLRITTELVAFKTSLCFFHKKGKCMNGDKCRFAHGARDLKTPMEDGIENASDCNADDSYIQKDYVVESDLPHQRYDDVSNGYGVDMSSRPVNHGDHYDAWIQKPVRVGEAPGIRPKAGTPMSDDYYSKFPLYSDRGININYQRHNSLGHSHTTPRDVDAPTYTLPASKSMVRLNEATRYMSGGHEGFDPNCDYRKPHDAKTYEQKEVQSSNQNTPHTGASPPPYVAPLSNTKGNTAIWHTASGRVAPNVDVKNHGATHSSVSAPSSPQNAASRRILSCPPVHHKGIHSTPATTLAAMRHPTCPQTGAPFQGASSRLFTFSRPSRMQEFRMLPESAMPCVPIEDRQDDRRSDDSTGSRRSSVTTQAHIPYAYAAPISQNSNRQKDRRQQPKHAPHPYTEEAEENYLNVTRPDIHQMSQEESQGFHVHMPAFRTTKGRQRAHVSNESDFRDQYVDEEPEPAAYYAYNNFVNKAPPMHSMSASFYNSGVIHEGSNVPISSSCPSTPRFVFASEPRVYGYPTVGHHGSQQVPCYTHWPPAVDSVYPIYSPSTSDNTSNYPLEAQQYGPMSDRRITSAMVPPCFGIPLHPQPSQSLTSYFEGPDEDTNSTAKTVQPLRIPYPYMTDSYNLDHNSNMRIDDMAYRNRRRQLLPGQHDVPTLPPKSQPTYPVKWVQVVPTAKSAPVKPIAVSRMPYQQTRNPDQHIIQQDYNYDHIVSPPRNLQMPDVYPVTNSVIFGSTGHADGAGLPNQEFQTVLDYKQNVIENSESLIGHYQMALMSEDCSTTTSVASSVSNTNSPKAGRENVKSKHKRKEHKEGQVCQEALSRSSSTSAKTAVFGENSAPHRRFGTAPSTIESRGLISQSEEIVRNDRQGPSPGDKRNMGNTANDDMYRKATPNEGAADDCEQNLKHLVDSSKNDRRSTTAYSSTCPSAGSVRPYGSQSVLLSEKTIVKQMSASQRPEEWQTNVERSGRIGVFEINGISSDWLSVPAAELIAAQPSHYED